MLIDITPTIIMIVISCGLAIVVVWRIIYEFIKKKRDKVYKSEYLSNLLKIVDPTTGLPKNIVDKTQADDYLREAKSMESKTAINKNIDDF